MQSELARAYPSAASRLVLVPDGVDTERFHPRELELSGARLRERLGVDARTPLVTFSARQPVLKGLPVLLEALAGLAELPWRLLVAGPKDPSRWERSARASGIALDRIAVMPELDPVATAAASDLAAHPTWRDACGLVVLEALACGTPVVTTARAGAAELVTSDAIGTVLEEPGDASALRAALARRLEHGRASAGDRAAARDAVRGRERAAWLGALEAILLDLRARPSL